MRPAEIEDRTMRAQIMVAMIMLTAGCAPHYVVGGENDAPVSGGPAPLAGCAPPRPGAGGAIVANADQAGGPFQYSAASAAPGNAGGGTLAGANSPPPPNPNCP
jgi:hypothetical protein